MAEPPPLGPRAAGALTDTIERASGARSQGWLFAYE